MTGTTEIFTTDGAGGFADQYGFSNRLVQNGDGSYSFTRKADHTRMDFDSTGKAGEGRRQERETRSLVRTPAHC